MFDRNEREDSSNFWISYADLMAGLLFVFILLVGAIVVKSVVLKGDLDTQKKRLETLAATLKVQQETLAHLAVDLNASKMRLRLADASLDAKTRRIEALQNTVAMQEARIARLEAALNESHRTVATLRSGNRALRGTIDDLNATLRRLHAEIAQERFAWQAKLSDLNATLRTKTGDIRTLQTALDEQTARYQALIERLRRQRKQIKALTGLRLQTIAALKAKLGDRLGVDKRSGALRLSSKVLFDKGSATLKEDAKAALKTSFEEYIRALLEDQRIAPYLDKIVIEGHTDSDGGFLYNLGLSQRRALSVMNYILTLPSVQRYGIRDKLVASGRAYLDPIYDAQGREDKEASRRIEITFRLKNNEAMQEIERILDAKER